MTITLSAAFKYINENAYQAFRDEFVQLFYFPKLAQNTKYTVALGSNLVTPALALACVTKLFIPTAKTAYEFASTATKESLKEAVKSAPYGQLLASTACCVVFGIVALAYHNFSRDHQGKFQNYFVEGRFMKKGELEFDTHKTRDTSFYSLTQLASCVSQGACSAISAFTAYRCAAAALGFASPKGAIILGSISLFATFAANKLHCPTQEIKI